MTGILLAVVNGRRVVGQKGAGRRYVCCTGKHDGHDVLADARACHAAGHRQTCRHCGRTIEQQDDGVWVDPEAPTDTDDVIWRETCDASPHFTADHEPQEG